MAKLFYVLTFASFLFVAAPRAEAASVTLAWDANTESDLAGYVVLFGSAPGRYDRIVEVGKNTTWTFSQAENNKTYYFVVQAVNTSGARSEFSSEVSASVVDDVVNPLPGTPPTGGGTSDLRIAVNRTSLSFGAIAGASTVRSAVQTASVTFSNGTAAWTVTTDAPWLKITGGSGSGPGSFGLSVKDDVYHPSTSTGTVTITAANVANSPLKIPVTLRVFEAGGNPTGVVDTPVQHATGVRGSIAITGWAIDDIDLEQVLIYRDPVAGEAPSPNGQMFVGKAVFVDGARPDVNAATDQPFDYEAGWGYMLLTNMLPNEGNGTFTLHVYAIDVEGHSVNIGSRTITCDNSKAIRPFGAIDTPEQGGTASGSSYRNWGWALASKGNWIPSDGSTILVYIDGVPVGRPDYNNARADIAELFPGYANTYGAVGYYDIDTTKLANGVHTISWVVTDKAGNSEGTGSRYFTVNNGAVSSSMTLEASTSIQEMSGGGAETRVSAGVGASTGLTVATIDAMPVSDVPVYRRDGFDQNAPLELTEADEHGVVKVAAEAAGRFTLTLSSPIRDDRGGYAGYLVAEGTLQALPTGSFLDGRSGEFYWQPGVGFIGTYQLVFVRTENGAAVRIPVEVTIGRGGSKPAMVVDTPGADAIVGSTFVAAGWAADFAAETGSGIRTVHAWAYPSLPGASPIFIGEATMGVYRPDVGIAHGEQYERAGYSISGTLKPGNYTLVVYAFSEVAKDFNNTISVPIVVK